MTKTDQEWAEFGKNIWDSAMNAHKQGSARIIVPFILDDGGMARVVIEPPTYTERRLGFINGEPRTEWRHGKKMSNGEIEWGEWSL